MGGGIVAAMVQALPWRGYAWGVLAVDPRRPTISSTAGTCRTFEAAQVKADVALANEISTREVAAAAVGYLIAGAVRFACRLGPALPYGPAPGPESTCWLCPARSCVYRWDDYNTNGDCLASK